jgi:2-C-methyl-D-erythritol 4-phosphate cytidylyltransferase / 2-C-methyl-D-erythritol 2,4-cyclodiphosphate synthase
MQMLQAGKQMPKIATVIVAAGKGERTGGVIPKQYVPLAGKAVLRRSVEAFTGYGTIQVMIGEDQDELFATTMRGLELPAPHRGGLTRQETVRLGLETLAETAPDYVLIHDAARPLVTRQVINDVIAALDAGATAAVPLLPVADTLRKMENGTWITVPRDGLMRAQTPQGFRYDAILQAHRDFAAAEVTDDMALAELAGMRIAAVPGDEKNIKITKAEDFSLAESFIAAARGDTRTGTGFDVHKFTAGDHVWLGGVKIPHDFALEGHSDADVALHALTDAILGAIAEGDIGKHFPPTDERWRGAASWQFLDHAAGLARAKGGEIVNCDVTVICESPKLRPHVEAMRLRIAEILKIEVSRVSVKATTTEKLGFTGRREGIAAEAVATVRL